VRKSVRWPRELPCVEDTAAIIDTRTPVRLPLGRTAVMGIAVSP
jgi:hypothetical protein